MDISDIHAIWHEIELIKSRLLILEPKVKPGPVLPADKIDQDEMAAKAKLTDEHVAGLVKIEADAVIAHEKLVHDEEVKAVKAEKAIIDGKR